MTYLQRILHEGLGARDNDYKTTGLTVFDGPYGSGKTLALRAVELAMTGKSRDISTISQLRETLGRSTATQQSVTVEIDNIEIHREWGKSQKLATDPPAPGIPPDLKLQQFWITNEFGEPPVTADLQEFNGLSPEKFKAWVLQKIGAEAIDIESTIQDLVDSKAEDLTDEQSEILAEALDALLKSNKQGKLSASEYIQVLEEKSREQKNTSVALLHDAEASRRESARQAGGTLAIAQAIADLQFQLETAKAEHQETVKSLGEQEERNNRIQAIKARIQNAEERLEGLQNIPEDWNLEQKAEAAKRILAAVKLSEEASANVQRGNQAERECLKRIENGNNSVAQFLAHSLERGEMLLEESDSDLKKATDRVLSLMQREMIRCPKCKHEFHEKSQESELESAKRNRETMEKRHRERLAQVEQERQVPGDYFLNDKELLRLQECRKQLAAEENTLQNIRRKLPGAQQKEEEAYEAVVDLLVEFIGDDFDESRPAIDLAREKSSLWLSMLTAIQSRDMTRNQKAQNEEELAGLATVNLLDLRDLEVAQKQTVQDLETRIREKQSDLAAANNEVRADERIQELAAQVEIEKLVVEIIQAVRHEVVENTLQGLVQTVNAILDCIAIGNVEIGDGVFVFHNQDGIRQWAALSSGERAFAGIAIAAAFAEKRGPQKLQCISVDNAECVGQEQLPTLINLCHRIWEQFRVQVLLAGHFDGAQLQDLDIQDLTIHDLRETVTA